MNELERVSKEYQEYAYIVSHDLNAPLRHIREFSKLLISTRSNDPSEEEKSHLNFLNQSLDKIEAMQKALLTFSRINTSFDNAQDISLTEVIKGVEKDFDSKINNQRAKIRIQGDAFITADYSLLHLMLSHILDNALSYCHDDKSTEINFIIKEKQNNLVLTIADNGIGFDQEYNKKVFKLFYRINPNSNGHTGAGLAFVKKIVELHKGTIDIFGEVNKGTTILITLPKHQS